MESTACYRGIVLKESLLDDVLPVGLQPMVRTQYCHWLDGKIPTTVYKLAVPSVVVVAVAGILAGCLRREKYFAQLTGDDTMLVIFPGQWLVVRKDSPDSAESARAVGREFGIPDHQMRFEAMFDNDHPNTNGRNA